jgi:hypothetical protein
VTGSVNEPSSLSLVVGVEETPGNSTTEAFTETDGNDAFTGGFVEERTGSDESSINDSSKSLSS